MEIQNIHFLKTYKNARIKKKFVVADIEINNIINGVLEGMHKLVYFLIVYLI